MDSKTTLLLSRAGTFQPYTTAKIGLYNTFGFRKVIEPEKTSPTHSGATFSMATWAPPTSEALNRSIKSHLYCPLVKEDGGQRGSHAASKRGTTGVTRDGARAPVTSRQWLFKGPRDLSAP